MTKVDICIIVFYCLVIMTSFGASTAGAYARADQKIIRKICTMQAIYLGDQRWSVTEVCH